MLLEDPQITTCCVVSFAGSLVDHLIAEVQHGRISRDIDLLVSNTAGPARLYRNDAEKQGAWLVLRAVYPEFGGRDAYGALITVSAGQRQWRQPVNPSFSYLSSSDPRVHFGLGRVSRVDEILVRWPDGTEERFDGGPINQFRVLAHGQGQAL